MIFIKRMYFTTVILLIFPVLIGWAVAYVVARMMIYGDCDQLSWNVFSGFSLRTLSFDDIEPEEHHDPQAF